MGGTYTRPGRYGFYVRPRVDATAANPLQIKVDLNRDGDFADTDLSVLLKSAPGKEPGAAITTENPSTLALLNLRGHGVEDLTGLEHTVNLVNPYSWTTRASTWGRWRIYGSPCTSRGRSRWPSTGRRRTPR